MHMTFGWALRLDGAEILDLSRARTITPVFGGGSLVESDNGALGDEKRWRSLRADGELTTVVALRMRRQAYVGLLFRA
jgi:hypothetical protein